MTNPIAKRAIKAAVIAALLSGKLIGIMMPMSIAPNTKPQMTPSVILDILPPLGVLTIREAVLNQLMCSVSRLIYLMWKSSCNGLVYM